VLSGVAPEATLPVTEVGDIGGEADVFVVLFFLVIVVAPFFVYAG